VASLIILLGADSVSFKTIRARDAKVAYEDAMKKAELEYNQKVLLATKNYRSRLEAAKGAVLAEGNLDEIKALQAEMDRLDQELKDYKDTRPVTGRGLIIAKAQFGISDRWADVTEQVRSGVRNNAIDTVAKLPDPAYGVRKTMIIQGSYGGKEFVLSFNEGKPASIVFGAPADDLNIIRR
jgi:hypothetical protein